MTYDEAVALARNLPPMTDKERREQALCFAYGNLACSTNHKHSRAAFRTVAMADGWTEAEFESWATDKEWRP